jgi:hypothetical protein
LFLEKKFHGFCCSQEIVTKQIDGKIKSYLKKENCFARDFCSCVIEEREEKMKNPTSIFSKKEYKIGRHNQRQTNSQIQIDQRFATFR